MHTKHIAIAVCLVVVAVAGCSSTAAPTDSLPADEGFQWTYQDNADAYMTEVRAFDVQIAEVIEEARAGGASAGQIGLLEQAQADGQLTLEQARTAFRSTIACFEANGLAAQYEESEDAGVSTPSYLVQAQDDGELASRDSCEVSEAFWVNYLYQTQAATIEQTLAYLEEHRTALERCVSDAGFEVAPDATGLELAFQAEEVAIRTSHSVNCLSDIGVSSL